MLSIIHQGHLGTEKCILKAKDCLYWPGIYNDIKEMPVRCQTCMLFSKHQPKQPLHPHSVPSFPWQKLGFDLFGFKGHQYLLVADYYSKLPVIRKLMSTTSSSIISHLKSIFAEQGISEELIPDNGPQYDSKDIAAFYNQWEITHNTSSPLYPRSNGFIERIVGTAKALLRKADGELLRNIDSNSQIRQRK